MWTFFLSFLCLPYPYDRAINVPVSVNILKRVLFSLFFRYKSQERLALGYISGYTIWQFAHNVEIECGKWADFSKTFFCDNCYTNWTCLVIAIVSSKWSSQKFNAKDTIFFLNLTNLSISKKKKKSNSSFDFLKWLKRNCMYNVLYTSTGQWRQKRYFCVSLCHSWSGSNLLLFFKL